MLWVNLFLEALLEGGRPSGDGSKFVAAVRHSFPKLGGRTKDILPRVHRSLVGSAKAKPEHSRLPLPWESLCGLVMVLRFQNKLDTALLLLVMFVCYLRPSEGSGLLRRDLNYPASQVGELRHYTLTLGARETGKATKTQVFDDSVPLDHPAWLGPLVAQRCHGRAVLHSHFPVTHQQLVNDFRAASELLHLPPTNLYQCRHGGASDDALARRRSQLEVMGRGRWTTAASVRRYSKASQVQKYLALLSPQVRRYCQHAELHLHDLLLGTSPPLRPPL